MTEIMNNLCSSFNGGIGTVVGMALQLLFTLMVLDLVTTIIFNFDQDYIKLLVVKCIKYGIWSYIISSAPEIAEVIKVGFVAIGNATGGGGVAINDPSAILNTGVARLDAVWQKTVDGLNMTASSIGGAVLLLLLVIVGIVCYFLIATGIFLQNTLWSLFVPLLIPLIATGVYPKLAFLAQSAISAIFSMGARFMVLSAIIGFCSQEIAALPPPDANMQIFLEHIAKLGAITIFTVIGPQWAAGFMSGAAPTLSANSSAKGMAGVGASTAAGGVSGAVSGYQGSPSSTNTGKIVSGAKGAITNAAKAGISDLRRRI